MHDADTNTLFRALPDEVAQRELVERFQPLAFKLAGRYAHRGIELDDLRQVACIGLLAAIDRFDPEFGSSFLSFAVPTITGELKRHFRDSGWGTAVPRRMKDVSIAGRRANEELSQKLGRSPTVKEVADTIGVTEDEVTEAAALGSAYRPDALDAPRREDGYAYGETLGDPDPQIDLVIDLDAVRPILEQRPEREQRILYLRFYEDLTQRQIADVMNISQMHVSRILAASLERMRVLLEV